MIGAHLLKWEFPVLPPFHSTTTTVTTMLRSSPPPSLSPPPATQPTNDQELKTDPQSKATQDTKDPLGEPDRERSDEGGADSDALAEPFPGFKYQEVLEKPFLVEQGRDVEFQERACALSPPPLLTLHPTVTPPGLV